MLADDQPTSVSRGSGRSSSQSAQRVACAVRDAASRAETSTGTRPAPSTGAVTGTVTGSVAAAGPSGASAGAGSAAGASSMITWALVPLMPKEEMPARRGCSPAGHGCGSVASDTAPAVQSTLGVGSSTCRVAGTVSCRNAITILITPATPAAAWVWPMFDFTEPSQSGRSAGRPCPYVDSSACASIGSPRVVPVPCASTTSTCSGASRALASAWSTTRCWDGPLGAVRPLLAPSWLTALPRTTARTGWPLRRASESRSTSKRPAPSPQAVPSAAAANDLTRPSMARPRWRLKPMKADGVDMTVAPPASARVHSPCRSAWQARCSATSDDEQAVSTVTAGPSMPSAYEIRPDTTLAAVPVRM